MKLVADDIETMRIVLRAIWTNAGHSAEAPEALCDLALKGLAQRPEALRTDPSGGDHIYPCRNCTDPQLCATNKHCAFAVSPQVAPQWIPVSERLPDEGQEVILDGVPEHLRYQCYARPDWIGPDKALKATHWLAIEKRSDMNNGERK